MRSIWLAMLIVGCGAAATPAPIETPPQREHPLAPPPIFLRRAPLTLRSTLRATQPPFYAELAADGAITGTRCSATRFTDDGVLEREGTVVARVERDGEAFTVNAADGTTLGWRIEGATLTTSAATRFTLAAGTITASGANLPAITVHPATTDETLALALFATLLVCDDVGP